MTNPTDRPVVAPADDHAPLDPNETPAADEPRQQVPDDDAGDIDPDEPAATP